MGGSRAGYSASASCVYSWLDLIGQWEGLRTADPLKGGAGPAGSLWNSMLGLGAATGCSELAIPRRRRCSTTVTATQIRKLRDMTTAA